MRDVYIVAAVRTAVGKAKRGTLAQVHPTEMAGVVLKEVVKRAGIDAAKVEDVTIGCAAPEGEQGMNQARHMVLRAGYPDTVPAMTINRFCSSGLESIMLAAAKIRCGMMDIAVSGGCRNHEHDPHDRRQVRAQSLAYRESVRHLHQHGMLRRQRRTRLQHHPGADGRVRRWQRRESLSGN